ncbi:MAG TPA: pyrroloquinoline quinone-dependent dehydrogenase [Candidatus Hydrogenedentes bacterium]|nr:pyrroloquinoline quinone-dependent dehydrogenase [Candidatus Hydrogenedentota bacterium]
MVKQSFGLLFVVALFCNVVSAQGGTSGKSWLSYGGDLGSTKYAPLSQIHRENVRDLKIAWTWESVDKRIQDEYEPLARATYFECTPLMVDGVLYGSTSLGQAFAIDAATGETIWSYSSEAFKAGRPPNLGYISRGVAYWKDGDDERIYMARSDSWLVGLDAKTGELVESFGMAGLADLLEGVPRVTRGRGYGHPSAPIIVRDVIVVGSSISDGPTIKEGTPGQVKGFDVRSGKLLWTFNIVPWDGEFGADTWEDSANTYTGSANVWTSISGDEELGYVYLPTSTPTNDFYGGHRLGDGLFAESLVCLNVKTGNRVWHFQTVHHGLWDYDLPCAPNLMDIVVDGNKVKAVAQVTKQGFVFVFDRVTGKPVWQIEERAVGQSTVPGEQTSLTQPFPTKPPPFTKQGVSREDVIDFTPELKAEALAILDTFNIGPLYTPPVVGQGTIIVPGYGGGANWPGASFDPETGYLYVPAMNHPSAIAVEKPDPARSNFRYTRSRAPMEGPEGLPLFKPPYAQVIAMDMNKGEIAWSVVNGGDGPINHPRLKELDLPPLGSNGRAGALVTKSLVFVTEGSGRSGSARGGGPHIRAFDKLTGEVVTSFLLPAEATGVPMSYMLDGKQYIVVAVGSSPAQLVALSL